MSKDRFTFVANYWDMGSFTNKVLMIRPANFGFNAETAVNNAFQSTTTDLKPEEIAMKAREEFDLMVAQLREAGIDVFVWQDTSTPVKPDAVFPNNWFSTTPDGALLTYPMYAENRRIERDQAILDYIESEFEIERRYNFEHYEDQNQFLEGTGSVLFDHAAQVVYACLSPRTDIGLLDKLCVLIGYEMVAFNSIDQSGTPIYHTNVMMTLTTDYVVICLDSVPGEVERDQIRSVAQRSGKEILELTYKQINAFAGNMIQLKDHLGADVIIMSAQAYAALNKPQIDRLRKNAKLITPKIDTIEYFGGGSARCMIAEIFLKLRAAYAK